jgi:Bacterial Ig domain
MKKNFFLSFLFFLLIFGQTVSAQTGENFNSQPLVPLKGVKNYLQNQCWTFIGFNVNGHNTNIEGDGTMMSESNPSPSYLLSPVLAMNNSLSISFNYKFNNSLQYGGRRWLKIYLADANNNLLTLLDSVEFLNINKSLLYEYKKTLEVPNGPHKIYMSYNGNGGSAAIGIDQLQISASRYYDDGCNACPVAMNDLFTGNENLSASGDVNANDSDPNGDRFSAYLIKPSPDGQVVLKEDGSFSFTPFEGFTGASTSFTYKICDKGLDVLCSDDATVTINFPVSDLTSPVSLVDFNGLYRDKGRVELNWATSTEHNSDRFEIERSFDGLGWKKVGTMKAQGISSVKKSYTFTDNAGRNIAIKNDLYYRLKQIGSNTKPAYTRILVVRVLNSHSTKMISVTPNPSKNDIAVNVQLNEGSFIVMKVSNSDGTELMKKAIKANAESNNYILEGTSQLQSGMYTLEVIVNSKERMMVKLMKE